MRVSKYDNFMEESRKAREDFDKIWNSEDEREVNAMLEKYELFIEKNFEPDFPLHESRPHSNLHGKFLIYSDSQLASDHIGYYSKDRLVTGEPTGAGFYEEYPHMTGSWVYQSLYTNGKNRILTFQRTLIILILRETTNQSSRKRTSRLSSTNRTK